VGEGRRRAATPPGWRRLVASCRKGLRKARLGEELVGVWSGGGGGGEGASEDGSQSLLESKIKKERI
jgi:hypothetical protein